LANAMPMNDINTLNISSLVEIVRRYVNQRHRHPHLAADPQSFNQLCAAMDCLGDVELGADAYEEQLDNSDVGHTYLIVYGILQLFFVQQDSIKALLKTFGRPYERTPGVSGIRELRNKSVGHPVLRHDKSSHFISRSDLSTLHFRLSSYQKDGRHESDRYDLSKLVRDQRGAIAEDLRRLIKYLRGDELAYREKHSDQKLGQLFHPTFNYHIGKIREGTMGGPDRRAIGEASLRMVSGTIDKISQALEQRNLKGIIPDFLDKAPYAIKELSKYFSQTDASRLSDDDAYVFAGYLAAETDTMRTFVKAIDEENASSELPG
jgi:hypothetical protein